jgi:hypothetical protein
MTTKQRTRPSPVAPRPKAEGPPSVIMPDQMPEAIDQRRQIRESFHDSKARVIKGKPRR